jgi:hypothetical protein
MGSPGKGFHRASAQHKIPQCAACCLSCGKAADMLSCTHVSFQLLQAMSATYSGARLTGSCHPSKASCIGVMCIHTPCMHHTRPVAASAAGGPVNVCKAVLACWNQQHHVGTRRCPCTFVPLSSVRPPFAARAHVSHMHARNEC